MRLDILFVCVCMLLIAASAGTIAYSALGLGAASAMLTAVAVLAMLGLLSVVSAVRARPAARTSPDLARINAEIARQDVQRQELLRQDQARQELAQQVGEVERGLATLERRVEGTIERARALTEPLTVELGELGTMVRQLAETLADHEQKLAEIAQVDADRAVIDPWPPVPVAAAPAPAPAEPARPPAPPAPAAAPMTVAEAMAATLHSAIDANRVDLYLQPMVTLPQRKVRYYEALSRLRSDKGDVVLATDFLTSADAHGLMPRIDNLVVFRCVQVVRRLLVKNREVGLFCNLSGATLTDGTVFPQLLEFLDANRAIASSIVLEFSQSVLRAAGPIESESLAALAERGYRFSLDNVTDLRFEPRELAARGFRFVKVRADLLLRRVAAASDIDPADLSDLLGRFGIDLVAERIESEGAVVDLLDHGVRFGQGFVFSPPRPVRAEALQGIGPLAREPTEQAAPPQAPAAAAGEPAPVRRASGIGQIARRI